MKENFILSGLGLFCFFIFWVLLDVVNWAPRHKPFHIDLAFLAGTGAMVSVVLATMLLGRAMK